ncbi:MAG TPA: DNA mismatch repair endonuclease MutL [bacterium]|nr:DNA mismatch repair endonuclease MutL [bacterium]
MSVPRIRVLDPQTAKRIAAGEVIDRPAAALRELLDNAIDSGATRIVVELEGGGAERLRVVDDGSGMCREDLSLSIMPHATSKIATLDDLLRLSTLGFRGEALSSIAAVASVEMISAEHDDEAWRLESEPGEQPTITPSRGSRGTAITVRNLFASFPARKKFLKSAAAEASACRAVFLDKAVAWPDVDFSLRSGGTSLLALRPATRVERVLAALVPDQPPELFRKLVAQGSGFRARIIAGLPAVYRGDRRHVQVFINGRRVQEYGIAQALEYAYRGALPGGAWPLVWAFIEVDPEQADFNIHPAKKEVRLKNIDDIRSGVIRAIRDYLGSQSRHSAVTEYTTALFDAPDASGQVWERPFETVRAEERATWSAIADAAIRARNEPGTALDAPSDSQVDATASPIDRFRYLGQALGVFLAFEDGDELVLMDQHAAHERVLYDQIMAGGVVSQDLLVPVVYDAESDEEDAYISANAASLAAAGYRLAREGRSWLLESAPAMLPESMTGSIFQLLQTMPDPAELLRETAAQSACKAAIKDGDALDHTGAIALIRAARALPEQRCPHGRPIWLRLGREYLFRAVRRIV